MLICKFFFLMYKIVHHQLVKYLRSLIAHAKDGRRFKGTHRSIIMIKSNKSPFEDLTANILDQYQCGNFIPVSSNHSYQIPMMLNYNSQVADPRAMKPYPETHGYYTKYEINEGHKFPDEIVPNPTSTDIATIPSNNTLSQKGKSTSTVIPRKPQSSFVWNHRTLKERIIFPNHISLVKEENIWKVNSL